MPPRLQLLLTLLLVGTFGVITAQPPFDGLDARLWEWAQGPLPAFTHEVVTALGRPGVGAGVVLVVAAYRRASLERTVLLFLVYALTVAVEVGLKLALSHALPGRGPAFLAEGLALLTAGSYPSGHAARIALICAVVQGRRVGGALSWVSAALIVSVACVELVVSGAHLPSDVVGGALLGGVLGRVGWSLAPGLAPSSAVRAPLAVVPEAIQDTPDDRAA